MANEEDRKKGRPPNLDIYIKGNKERFVTYYQGARLYDMGYSKFLKLAKEAGANLPIRKTSIVDLDKVDAYLVYLRQQEAKKTDEELEKKRLEEEEMARLENEFLEMMTEADRKKYIRYDEGALLYSMSLDAFRRLAIKAGATHSVGRAVLVNREVVDEYIESQSHEINYKRSKKGKK